MHSWHLRLGKNLRHMNFADKNILIELSELVVFDYGPSDTQNRLMCLRNGIYIFMITYSPCDKYLGERSWAQGLSCLIHFYKNIFQKHCQSVWLFKFIAVSTLCWFWFESTFQRFQGQSVRQYLVYLGITVFKMSICVVVSSDIQLEIKF